MSEHGVHSCVAGGGSPPAARRRRSNGRAWSGGSSASAVRVDTDDRVKPRCKLVRPWTVLIHRNRTLALPRGDLRGGARGGESGIRRPPPAGLWGSHASSCHVCWSML